ncbi:MAG: beta-glucosidase [Chloroflexi bacterium]|nr:beta-glucosidase [Chloroflexota bacterium]
MGFPKNFVWGTATASYQIEGSMLEDGRGECVWYRFSHTPGKVNNNDTGDVACDHYHRYREDVALMAELGVPAYRFSIAWPRVLPQGIGVQNPAGLDFYDRLVDELLAHNIRPFVTLNHWDYPQALQDRGGWQVPASIEWFSEYADLMSRRLGDRVKDWITHNEPLVVAYVGYMFGHHAPGLSDRVAAFKVAHHLLMSHGAAVPIIRRNCAGAQVGITLNLSWLDPASDSQADREAVRRDDGFGNRWFLDPVFKGEYPADMVASLGETLEGLDLAEIKQAAVPTDFLGINYYTRGVVAADDTSPTKTRRVRMTGNPHTEMNWEVYPDGLRNLLVRVWKDYAPPAIYITENGAAYDDPTPQDGVVEDPDRIAYYQAHWKACEQALEQGVPLKGYFAWSLLDNFEWAHGYSKRFGLIYTDYATQQRTLKRSALVYRDLIARHKVQR